MARFVLTLVGADRAGLVAAVADAVRGVGGNWEASRLAELAGTFAGVVLVRVPDERADALRRALTGLDGLLTVTAHEGAETDAAPAASVIEITVLGNDRPGIVREISAVLDAHGVSIDRMTTQVREAAMAGGELFEASISARLPAGTEGGEVRRRLEEIAAEIQVDLSVSH